MFRIALIAFALLASCTQAATPMAASGSGHTIARGWWWNPEESGRGFFIEWQNGSVDIAGYMYDDAGNAVWYLTVVPTPDPRAINGAWWTFGGGQTLTGAYRPNMQTSNNFAPVAVAFDSPTSGTLTLPGGRTTRIVRHRF